MSVKSIFDLPTKDSDLSSTNQGMADVYYDQIQSLKGIGDTDSNKEKFGTETYIYRWQMDAGSWWVPSRSYFKIRVKLAKANGNQLDLTDDIAPMMGCASGLFNKISYKILNRTVSELSQFIPQIDAYKKRINKSGQWMRDVGAAANFYQSSFQDRQNQVIDNDLVGQFHRTAINRFGSVRNLFAAGRINGANRLQIQAFTANREIRFLANGGAAVPDLATLFAVGDKIFINMAATNVNLIQTIIGFRTTTTANDGITFAGATIADQAAENLHDINFQSSNAYGKLNNVVFNTDTIEITAANEIIFRNGGAVIIPDLTKSVRRQKLRLAAETSIQILRRSYYLLKQFYQQNF